MKIENLTAAQTEAITNYREMGIRIGLAAGPDMDDALVRDLTDKHRELHNIPKATYFDVYDSPFAAVAANPGLSVYNALYGQHDSPWLTFYLFFRVECGLTKETDDIKYLIELMKHTGWMWMSSNTTIVTRRPEEIHLLSQKQESGQEIKVLHNLNGMALKYRDGTGVYTLYGTRIPSEFAWIITNRGRYDISDVLHIKNAAIKTAALRMLGPKALIKTGKAIDKWTSKKGGKYILYKVTVNGNDRVYLSGSCPSKKEPFCEPVPPTITTCVAALAFREKTVGEYMEPCIRT